MNTPYFCMACGFHTHQKTLRLRSLIGDRAFYVPPMLWGYAAMNQRDGNFSDYTASDFEGILQLPAGEGLKIKKALVAVQFLDARGRLRNWKRWNKFFSTNPDRFKKAIKARWREVEEVYRVNLMSREAWFELPPPERRRLVQEHRAKQNPSPALPSGAAPELNLTAPAEKSAAPSSSKKTWDLSKRVEAMDRLIKTHKGNASHPQHDPLAGAELRALKRDRDGLLKQISGITPGENKNTKNA